MKTTYLLTQLIRLQFSLCPLLLDVVVLLVCNSTLNSSSSKEHKCISLT